MWSRNVAAALAELAGAKWVGMPCENEPLASAFAAGAHPREQPYGGAGALIFNPSVDAVVRGQYGSGVVTMSFNVEGKQGFSCIAVYLPPEGSPYADSVKDRLRVVEAEHAAESKFTKQILVLGDVNTRVNNAGLQRTPASPLLIVSALSAAL